MTFSRTLILALLVVTPGALFAQQKLGTLVEFADTLANGVVTSVGYLMFTLAIVGFLWGMVQFIWAARQGDGGKGVKEGKQFMLWGLIALFVMFSVWGIITWAQSILNLSGKTTIVIPSVQLLPVTSGTKQGSKTPSVACTFPNEIQGNTCVSLECQSYQSPNGKSCEFTRGKKDGICDASAKCVSNTSGSPGKTDAQIPCAVTVNGTRFFGLKTSPTALCIKQGNVTLRSDQCISKEAGVVKGVPDDQYNCKK